MARPIPDAAPVMMATLSCSCMDFSFDDRERSRTGVGDVR
jgi:hypothetical protein